MGRIYLNQDKKLVVETDNGIINPDGTTTVEILGSEIYAINSTDIAKLVKIVNNQDTKGVHVYYQDTCYPNYSIVSDEEITSKFKELEDKLNGDIKMLKDKYEKCLKRKEYLEKKIRYFNEDIKLFWRPLKIED